MKEGIISRQYGYKDSGRYDSLKQVENPVCCLEEDIICQVRTRKSHVKA